MRWGDKLEALTVSPLGVKILTPRQQLHQLENTP